MEETAARVSKLRDLLEGLSQIPLTIVNGDTEHRLPGNVNVCFQGIEVNLSRCSWMPRGSASSLHLRFSGPQPCAFGPGTSS